MNMPMFFAVSSVADSITTQPSIPATLPGSRSSLWTDGRRCRVFGRCLRARAYPWIGTRDSPLPVYPAQRRGQYGPRHTVSIAPYRALRIRPTVARQELPDGRRVTGPVGSGEDTASSSPQASATDGPVLDDRFPWCRPDRTPSSDRQSRSPATPVYVPGPGPVGISMDGHSRLPRRRPGRSLSTDRQSRSR